MFTLDALMDVQYGQQREMIASATLDDAERIRIGIELCAGIGEEVTEYLRYLGYKSILPDRRTAADRRSGRLMEIADLMKYVLSLAHLDGITPDELAEAVMLKTEQVRSRYRSEIAATRIVGFDIDGVLADLAGAGYDWSWSDEEKRAFFDDGGALRCAPIPDMPHMLRAIKARGWGIVLVTARKTHLHPRLEAETYQWLREHDIPYDRVIFAHDKAQALVDARLPLRFFVEDSAKHAMSLADAGFTVWYVNNVPLDYPGDMICLTADQLYVWLDSSCLTE